MKAVLCPVCEGKGKIQEYYPTDTAIRLEKCHGCDGKGWVEVNEMNQWHIFHSFDKVETQSIPDYNKCPSCGGDRNSPAGIGCPIGSHYGSYCSIQ